MLVEKLSRYDDMVCNRLSRFEEYFSADLMLIMFLNIINNEWNTSTLGLTVIVNVKYLCYRALQASQVTLEGFLLLCPGVGLLPGEMSSFNTEDTSRSIYRTIPLEILFSSNIALTAAIKLFAYQFKMTSPDSRHDMRG